MWKLCRPSFPCLIKVDVDVELVELGGELQILVSLTEETLLQSKWKIRPIVYFEVIFTYADTTYVRVWLYENLQIECCPRDIEKGKEDEADVFKELSASVKEKLETINEQNVSLNEKATPTQKAPPTIAGMLKAVV